MRKKLAKQLRLPLITFVLGVASGMVILAGLIYSSPYNFGRPYSATFHTNYGIMTMKFNTKAVNSVQHFTQLVRSGFYDGTRFHRVVPQFLIQGGDPLSKNTTLKNLWGKGGPGFVVADEIGENEKFVRGAVALTNQGPNTSGSQFFILVADSAQWLDGQHTIIGWITQGMEVADAISKIPISIVGIPQEDVVINKITLY